MEVTEETKLCPNCKHQISTANFSLHTVHCQRSLTLCPKCDEAIPRTAVAEHMESAHKEVACPLCHVRVENFQLEQHQSEVCAKRLIKCEYCEVDCHAGELQEHEDYCGSRTELCETCGQYILIKDEAVHIASGHAPKDRNKNKQDNVLMSKEAVESAFNTVHTNRPKVPNVDRDSAVRQSPSKRSNDMPQINTRASLNTEKDSAKPGISDSQSKREALDQLLALHLAGNFEDADPADIPYFLQNNTFSQNDDGIQSLLRSSGSMMPEYDPDSLWDYDTEGFVTEPNRITQPLTQPQEQSINTDTDETDVIPCEFCGQLCSVDYIVQHESGCRPDLVHGSPKELNNTQPNLHSGLPIGAPVVTNTNREFSSLHNTALPMSSDDDMLPCEICGELYPSELLSEHQSLCPAKDEFSNVRFDLPEADRSFALRPLQTPESRIDTIGDYADPEVNFSPMTSDDDMIPCEICGENFSSDIIIEHQNFCANFKDPVETTPDSESPQPEVQLEQKENFPIHNRVQNGLIGPVEKPNSLKAIETNKEPYHRPSVQHVKFGALPNSSSHRQPRVVTSTPILNHELHPRVRNVPISVASDYHHPTNTYSKSSPNYFKNSKDNGSLHIGGALEKPSPSVNSYVRETRKALNPVKEALRQETVRQNMRNSGTGTRPKNQTTRDDGAFGVNRLQNQTDTQYSRYSYEAKRRETEPNIPSYLRSQNGKLEEAFKTFLANRQAPSRIGQYRSSAPLPHQRTVAQASGDRRSVAGHETSSRLPPIVGMGAVPKKKDSRKTNDE